MVTDRCRYQYHGTSTDFDTDFDTDLDTDADTERR